MAACQVPTPRPGEIVVMDDLTCHEAPEVARLVAAAGAEVRYLPPYSSDLNPIERLVSMLEAALREAKARAVEAMGEALRAFRPGDTLGWFGHIGYRPHGSTARVKGKPLQTPDAPYSKLLSRSET